MTRSISLVAALLLSHLLFGGIAFAESTVTYPEHVDHPELYVLPAPAKKSIDIVVNLMPNVTAGDVQPLSDWLTDGGFRIIDGESGYLHIAGSVEDAEDAFQTQIMMTREGSYGNLSDPKIPARFANVVRSISGLSEIFLGHGSARRASPMPTFQPHSQNYSSDLLQSHTFFLSNGALAFGPADEQTFYDAASLISSGTNGSSVDCIALTEDSTFTAAAVTNFNSTFMLPQFGTSPALTTVLVGTGQTENGDETEALIDIEWAHALAPMANIHVYISAPGPTNVQLAIEKTITDNICGTISISQTLCGNAIFFESTLGSFFQQAAQHRQAVFTGTGDRGAAEDTITSGACPSPAAGIKELAASPYVTAVGGTMFTPTYNGSGNDVGSVAESVWNDGTGAGGGGVSMVFPEPAFQAQQTLPASSFRAIPDVSLGASPDTPGFWIVNAMNGTPTPLQQFGGTSLASPAWAGIGALLADQAKERVGNINSRLYQMGPLGSSVGIRDVTAGNNTVPGVTGVSAGPGYDEASGWGTPDVTNFANAFQGQVLISGGEHDGTVVNTAETFNPSPNSLTYTATGKMSVARMCHTSTLLENGQTLVAGGVMDSSDDSLASAELFTPSTRMFVSTGSMNAKRFEHGAVLLNNGSVLVMGGFKSDADSSAISSAELYNPSTSSFSFTGAMSVARGAAAATLLTAAPYS
jgi:subtilase family serine protease